MNVASGVIFAGCFWLNSRGHVLAALVIGGLEIVTHAVLASLSVGWSSGFHYYILGLAPLIYFSPRWSAALKVCLVAGLCGVHVGLYAYSLTAVPWVAVDASRLQFASGMNEILLVVVSVALAYFYRLAATNAEAALTRANHVRRQTKWDKRPV